MRCQVAGVLAFAFLTACGSAETTSTKPTGSGGSSGSFGNTPTTPSSRADGCTDAARLVYVVSDTFDLYSFKPDQLVFTKIGQLDCAAGGATPNSMAVDRAGIAWVNYSDGSLFQVDTRDASCKPTAFQKNQKGFARFGMAFASNSAGSQEETLYVVGLDGAGAGRGFGKIDTKTLELVALGDFTGTLAGRGAELTGTGEAKLFGFFTTQPATLAQIDKAKGATSEDKALAGVSTGNAWAFSFWGGDFWFYTSTTDTPSKVTRLRTSDNSLTVVKQDVGGFQIVGAGVSTCAPTVSTR